MKVGAAAWRLGLSAVVMIVVLSVVFTAIKRPVGGETATHQALFTDANGLKVGDDVRQFGVQVGKVEHISLDGTLARVRLSLKTDAPIFDNSKLAIRYQNLTGQRYIDLQQQPKPGTRLPAGRTIGIDHTVPSFDVTSMFNGLKPVLAAIGRLASYVDDRQQVIGALIHNMSDLSQRVGGRVHYLVPLLARLTDIFQALQTNIGGLAQFAMAAPSVLGPLDSLFDALGLQSGNDVDALIRRLFPDPKEAVDVFGKLPALLGGLDAATPKPVAGWKPQCSKGNAELPQVVRVLVADQQVAICNG